METRMCKKCCIEKTLDQFVKHSMVKGGYLYTCKSCNGVARRKEYSFLMIPVVLKHVLSVAENYLLIDSGYILRVKLVGTGCARSATSIT